MKTYVIIPTVNIVNEMVEEALESPTSIRTSLDGSQSILKFSTPFPSTMGGYTKYSHSEMLDYLATNTVDWEEV